MQISIKQQQYLLELLQNRNTKYIQWLDEAFESIIKYKDFAEKNTDNFLKESIVQVIEIKKSQIETILVNKAINDELIDGFRFNLEKENTNTINS